MAINYETSSSNNGFINKILGYSKPVTYAILIVCLCVIIAYIIVIITLSSKYGKRVWVENIKKLNIATTVTIICTAIAALIIKFVPFIKYPILNAVKRTQSKINKILDSGNTPYFNPPVYKFKHGQYMKTTVIPYSMDKFGLPKVDENVPLNSFNLELFRLYHKTDLDEYDIVKNNIANTYTNDSSYTFLIQLIDKFSHSKDELIFEHIDTIFDTISDIMRISTIGDQCLIVKSIGNNGMLIHKNMYMSFISDSDIIAEMQFYNKYNMIKHYDDVNKLTDLNWFSQRVIHNDSSIPLDTFNNYFLVYDELRVLYSIFVDGATDNQRYDNIIYLTDIIKDFIINDDKFGLLHILNSMIFISCIDRYLSNSKNYMLRVVNYLRQQPNLDMEMFYRYILENDEFVHIKNILQDVYKNSNVVNIAKSINDIKNNVIIDSLSSTSTSIDINAIEIRILLPYMNDYGMLEEVKAHNKNIDTISRNISGIIDRIRNKRSQHMINKLLQTNMDQFNKIKMIGKANDEELVETPAAILTSAHNLRDIISKRLSERQKMLKITSNGIQSDVISSKTKQINTEIDQYADILKQLDDKMKKIKPAIALIRKPASKSKFSKIFQKIISKHDSKDKKLDVIKLKNINATNKKNTSKPSIFKEFGSMIKTRIMPNASDIKLAELTAMANKTHELIRDNIINSSDNDTADNARFDESESFEQNSSNNDSLMEEMLTSRQGPHIDDTGKSQMRMQGPHIDDTGESSMEMQGPHIDDTGESSMEMQNSTMDDIGESPIISTQDISLNTNEITEQPNNENSSMSEIENILNEGIDNIVADYLISDTNKNDLELIQETTENIETEVDDLDEIDQDIVDVIDDIKDILDTAQNTLPETVGNTENSNVKELINKFDNVTKDVEDKHTAAVTTYDSFMDEINNNDVIMNNLVDNIESMYMDIKIKNLQLSQLPVDDPVYVSYKIIDDIHENINDNLKHMHSIHSLISTNPKMSSDDILKNQQTAKQLMSDTIAMNTLFMKMVEQLHELIDQKTRDEVEQVVESHIVNVLQKNADTDISEVKIQDAIIQGEQNATVDKYEKEIQQLKTRQEQQAIDIDNSKKQIEEKEQKLKDAEDKLQSILSANNDATQTISDEIVSVREQLDKSNMENAKLQSEKLLLDSELKNVRDDIQSLQFNLYTNLDSLARTPDILDKLSKSKNDMTDKIEVYQEENMNIINVVNEKIQEMLLEQSNALTEQHAQELEQAIQEHQNTIAQAKNDLNEQIRKTIMEFKITLISEIGSEVKLRDDMTLEECLSTVETFMRDNKSNAMALNEKITNLENKESKLLMDKKIVDKELEKTRSMYEQDKLKWESIRQSLTADSQRDKERIEELMQADRERNQAELKRLTEESEQIQLDLEAKIAPTVMENEQLRKRKRELDEKIHGLETENSNLNARVAEMEQKIKSSSMQQGNYDTDIKTALMNVSQYKHDLETITAKYEKSVNDYAFIDKSMDEKRLEIESLTKQLAARNVEARENALFCIGIGGEYKNKKMRSLYPIKNVVHYDNTPIDNLPELTKGMVSTMTIFVEDILNKKSPNLPRPSKSKSKSESKSESEILDDIFKLRKTLVSDFPNKSIYHGSIYWVILTIIYSVYQNIINTHDNIIRELSKCGIDDIQSFNDNIYIMEQFISKCSILFNDTPDEFPNLSIFELFENDTMQQGFKNIILLFDETTNTYLYKNDEYAEYAIDRLKLLLELFGFDTPERYDALYGSENDEDTLAQWVQRFSENIPAKVNTQSNSNNGFNPEIDNKMQQFLSKSGKQREEMINEQKRAREQERINRDQQAKQDEAEEMAKRRIIDYQNRMDEQIHQSQNSRQYM